MQDRAPGQTTAKFALALQVNDLTMTALHAD